MYSKLSIKGLRGFSQTGNLNLSIPNGQIGSGLTTLVGPNNAGKSTIIEAFKAFNSIKGHNKPSFTEGKRNKNTDDRIELKLYKDDDNFITLRTSPQGGSETESISNGLEDSNINIFVIKSRRTFNPYFSKSKWNRNDFFQHDAFEEQRSAVYNNFSNRLFNINENPNDFNKILSKVLSPLPNWTIDQSDNGNYYIKFNYDNHYHSSEGAGEGLLSIFTIVDALYDSQKDDIIVIDEPELSLHPSLQRKLCQLLLEFSADRQIVISTHSPYFVSWESLLNGGKLARIIKKNNGTEINQLVEKQIQSIKQLLGNFFNPHTLGIDAKEIFFLEDNVLIVEGQEDVVYFQQILNILHLQISGSFFGWGIGGAGNLDKILDILNQLGYDKVSVILDKNMEHLIKQYSKDYPYLFQAIPTNDIRDKKAIQEKSAVEGLIDQSGKIIKEQYIDDIQKIINNINEYNA
ncbi:Predicted ATPase [Chryseobacterium oranimense]|uniref:Predicted ATPase n=1 Tax=Chryseobacterium oranimense TaxID=421058 RepID=A0A1M5VL36_9FLAO|nr:ATP-binding protein [Chryseobacterium oranimense]SHH75920.1 Predicted ATPase [Chryseobacterium oranimense]